MTLIKKMADDLLNKEIENIKSIVRQIVDEKYDPKYKKYPY